MESVSTTRAGIGLGALGRSLARCRSGVRLLCAIGFLSSLAVAGHASPFTISISSFGSFNNPDPSDATGSAPTYTGNVDNDEGGYSLDVLNNSVGTTGSFGFTVTPQGGQTAYLGGSTLSLYVTNDLFVSDTVALNLSLLIGGTTYATGSMAAGADGVVTFNLAGAPNLTTATVFTIDTTFAGGAAGGNATIETAADGVGPGPDYTPYTDLTFTSTTTAPAPEPTGLLALMIPVAFWSRRKIRSGRTSATVS